MKTELSTKQLQAALLLATGKTITHTAGEVEVSRVTLHEWLKNDDYFIAHLNGLKLEIIEAGRVAIQSAVSLAAETIAGLMAKSDNDAVKLAAAKDILNRAGIVQIGKVGSDDPHSLAKWRAITEQIAAL
jgi:hypothetical protein